VAHPSGRAAFLFPEPPQLPLQRGLSQAGDE
jgi:hypothetical protein